MYVEHIQNKCAQDAKKSTIAQYNVRKKILKIIRVIAKSKQVKKTNPKNKQQC